MSQPAARVSDMHTCPMLTPAVPPIPHVGGPVLPPGEVRALIGGLPAARVGDMCVCVGPPDVIVKGAFTVMIGGRPAARMGDNTAHGGVIVGGFPQVLIGEQGTGGGGPGAGAIGADAGSGLVHTRSQRAALAAAADSGAPFCEACERAVRGETVVVAPPQSVALRRAAQSGTAFCEECDRAREAMDPIPTPAGVDPATQRAALTQAAKGGAPFCEECSKHAGATS
jgi:uncharacterized Zn-binding protein involved in type VI secretion